MKVGIIAPIRFLDKYCVTDIQYCLPSFLVESAEYQDFYKSRKRQGDTVILDCRKPGWKREPENFRTVELALEMLRPNIVIAPSHMFNLKESEDIYKEFVEEFSSFKHIIIRCLEVISSSDIENFPKSRTFAIPSHSYRYVLDGNFGPNIFYIENHLNLNELDGRKGILVTSLPIRLGLQGRLVSDYKPSPNSLTFYEEEDPYPKVTMKNVMDTIEYYKE